MADLDPVIQEILLEGNSEVLRGLQEIGEKGSEALKQLIETAEGGGSSLEGFANALGSITGAVSAGVTALAAFVESQDEATQRTQFLAQAMSTTAASINGIEDAFAAAGVSASTFERFAQRLTTTIAQQWPEITAAVRTGATQQSEAQEQIVSATMKVKAAQDAVAFGAEEDANKSEAAALRVASTYQRVQEAAQEAANTRIRSEQSVEASQNSVEAAEQRLATLQGNPPTAAAKQALELSQAELAVDQARQSAAEAREKQQNAAAEAATKAAQVQLDHSNTVLAQEKLQAELQNANLQRANAAAEAQDRLATAEEHAAKIALSNLPAITAALGGVVDKNEEMAKSVDLNSVSVQNLNRGIINLAAQANNGIKPTGIQTFNELVKVLSNTTDEMISRETQLALVMQFGGRSMQQAGASASELLNAIKLGPAYFDSYVTAAGKYYSTTEEGVKAAEDFKKSLESFQQALQLTMRDLAAFASPALIAFFDALKSSLTSTNGLLHQFVSGLEGIGAIIQAVVQAFIGLAASVDKAFNLQAGTTMQTILAALLGAVAFLSSGFIGLAAAITVVVAAIGEVYQNWDKVKAAAVSAWEAIVAGAKPVVDIVTTLVGWLLKAVTLWGQLLGAKNSNPQGNQSSGDQSGAPQVPISRAEGGPIRGPGSGTSDSILARLSNGEFVMKAASVQRFGEGFMHAINNGMLPGFASGGLVPSPVRMANSTGVGPVSTVNLSIDGRSFNGLRGPKSTVDDLTSYAISRQSSAAGKNPSWVG